MGFKNRRNKSERANKHHAKQSHDQNKLEVKEEPMTSVSPVEKIEEPCIGSQVEEILEEDSPFAQLQDTQEKTLLQMHREQARQSDAETHAEQLVIPVDINKVIQLDS